MKNKLWLKNWPTDKKFNKTHTRNKRQIIIHDLEDWKWDIRMIGKAEDEEEAEDFLNDAFEELIGMDLLEVEHGGELLMINPYKAIRRLGQIIFSMTWDKFLKFIEDEGSEQFKVAATEKGAILLWDRLCLYPPKGCFIKIFISKA